MARFALFGAVALLCASVIVADTYLTLPQPLDHHCANCTGTFDQSFVWINDTGTQRGDPVILFLGGQSAKFNFQTRLSQFVKYATIYKCTFLLLEHRFYGISVPSAQEDTAPYALENLKYLDVEQALLDTQAFITSFQNSYMPKGTKWILAGEGYGASLAAWYTQRFLGPNATGVNAQFVATVSSSAALEAREDFADFFQEFEPASLNITGSDVCAGTIRDGTHEINKQLHGQQGGRAAVAKLFGSCEDEISPENEFFFKYAVSEVIASSLVLNTPPVWSLNRTCVAALNNTEDGSSDDSAAAVARAFAFNMDFEYQLCLEVCNGTSTIDRVSEVVFRPLTENVSASDSDEISASTCVSFDEHKWLESMRDESNPARAKWWQRCTELGQFHGVSTHSTSASAPVFFDDLSVDRVVGYCEAIFGIRGLRPDTRRFNAVYGGITGYKAHSVNAGLPAIYFANANMDPLQYLAPQKSNDKAGYSVVNYVGGQDSFGYGIFTSPADPSSLTSARLVVGDFLNRSMTA